MSEVRKKILEEDITFYEKTKTLCLNVPGLEIRLTKDHVEAILGVMDGNLKSAQCNLLFSTVTFSRSSQIKNILEVDVPQVGGSPNHYFIEDKVLIKVLGI